MSTKCSTILGWLFEGYANEILRAGGDFNLRSLNFDERIEFHLHRGEIFVEESSHGISSNVSVIPRIGPVVTKELYSKSINTIEDLINAIENPNSPEIQKFNGRFDRFMKYVNSDIDFAQYVLELEGDYYM
jgi:hypothetical protein